MYNKLRKSIAFLLSFVMMLSSFSVNLYADENEVVMEFDFTDFAVLTDGTYTVDVAFEFISGDSLSGTAYRPPYGTTKGTAVSTEAFLEVENSEYTLQLKYLKKDENTENISETTDYVERIDKAINKSTDKDVYDFEIVESSQTLYFKDTVTDPPYADYYYFAHLELGSLEDNIYMAFENSKSQLAYFKISFTSDPQPYDDSVPPPTVNGVLLGTFVDTYDAWFMGHIGYIVFDAESNSSSTDIIYMGLSEDFDPETDSNIASNINDNRLAITYDTDSRYLTLEKTNDFIQELNLYFKTMEVKTDADGATYPEYSEAIPFNIKVLKAGDHIINDEELGIIAYSYTNSIPYDTVFTLDYVENATDINLITNKIVSEYPQYDIMDFTVFDFDLIDPVSRESVKNLTGAWDHTQWPEFGSYRTNALEIHKKILPDEYSLSKIKAFKITENDEIIELELGTDKYSADSVGRMKLNANIGESLKGRYIIMREAHVDLTSAYDDSKTYYTPVVDGSYKIPVTVETTTVGTASDFGRYVDGRAVLELSGVTANTVEKIEDMASLYDNAEAYSYVYLKPALASYIESVKIDDTEVEWIEEYMVDGKAYPKIIKIDTEKAAYVEAVLKNTDGTVETVNFVFDYMDRWDAESFKASAPEITTDSAENKFTFVNGASTNVTITTSVSGGTVYYTLNGEAETEYTTPIFLESTTDKEEKYEITAYVKKDDAVISESETKTIRFRHAGAYADDVANPVIKARYKSGKDETEGIYSVEIVSETQNAVIYYTLDGSEPDESAAKYENKIEVSALTNGSPTVIKAIGYAENHNASEISEFTISFSTEWWDSIVNGDNFQVEVEMWKWGENSNSYSMGNGALTGVADLIKVDGQMYANIYFQEIDMDITVGHLIDMWWFEYDIQDYLVNGTTMQNLLTEKGINWAGTSASMKVMEEFGIAGDYTFNEDGTIDYVTLPLFDDTGTTIIALESDFAAMGKQYAKLVFDYSNAYKEVTGKEMAQSNKLTPPDINVSLNSAGDAYTISFKIPDTSKVTDADIYYMFNGSDDLEFEQINLYTEPITLTLEAAAALGGVENTFNIFAQAVKSGYEDSVVAARKIAFNSAGDGSTGSGSNSSKYWVPVQLYKAELDKVSMGDAAFANNRDALITITDSKAEIQMASNPVSITPYYSALEDLQYKDSNNIYRSVTPVETQRISTTYQGENYSFDYLKIFEFTNNNPQNDASEEFIDVQIKVPYTIMDEAVGEGYIEARLKFKWNESRVADANATLTANTTAATGTSSVSGPEIQVTDSETGIIFSAEENIFPEGSELSITALNSQSAGKEYGIVVEVLGEELAILDVFNIVVMLEDEKQTPVSNVHIYFPIKEEYDLSRLQVYRINEPDEDRAVNEENYYTKTLLEYEITEDGNFIDIYTGEIGLFAIVHSETELVDSEDFIVGIESESYETIVGEEGFVDISDHWAEEYIHTAINLGLFSGVSETEFEPDMAVDRGMFTAILGRMADIQEGYYKTWNYSDVREGDYFATAVAWATLMGITSGIESGVFGAYDEITREQIAVMLVRFAQSQEIELSASEPTGTFKDDEEASIWAKDSINILAQAGVINGRPDGRFDPKGSATRAESAVMLVNFIKEYMPEKIMPEELHPEEIISEDSKEEESELTN